VTTGASVRARLWVARLMILAVFAMMLGQVVVFPSLALSLNDAAFSDRQSSATQSGLDQGEPSLPCHHRGSTPDSSCCLAAGCPMLTLTLPIVPPAVLPMELRLPAYTPDAMQSPDGTVDAPLVPPPRHLV
jgi:hypothetical protein